VWALQFIRKGRDRQGATTGAFYTSYFDKWAAQAIWLVRFRQPFVAVTFEAVPIHSLKPRVAKLVRFHLSNVLGNQFHLSLVSKFSTLPNELALRLQSKPTLDGVKSQLDTELRISCATMGLNSWSSAFFRGLLADETAIGYLMGTMP
jgi:hypothetical protein